MAREIEERREGDIAYKGPYNTGGKDYYGHPLNSEGRCELMNRNPPECPPEDDEEE